jgi:hypothetical protein
MAKTKADLKGGRKLGRPPGDPESKRHNRVVTLMTDAESEKLTQIAELEDKSVSALVHDVLVRFIHRRKKTH